MSLLHHICTKVVECTDEFISCSLEAIVVCGVIQGLWLFSPGTDGP